MDDARLTVRSNIDAATFREFALFDAFSYRGRWRAPALFAAFFAALAALAFSRASAVEGAALLGGVLLTVGLGLPLLYIINYVLSVRRRAAALTGREAAYTVTLSGAGVEIVKGDQRARYAWDEFARARRLAHSVCLYDAAGHAFLLPRSDAACDAAWELICASLPAERVKV